MNTVIERVQRERSRQDKKWGEQNHNVVEWIAILMEEIGEASKEAVDFHFGYKPKTGLTDVVQSIRINNLKKELIQSAAVAIAIVESIERQNNYD